MRKLMWFTVGFAAACICGAYLLRGFWLLLIGLFCLIGFAAMLLFRTKPAKITAVVLFGCLIGFLWFWGYDGIYLSTARKCDAETLPLTVTAADYSYRPSYGSAFDGHLELDGKTYRVRCYLNTDTPIVPGNQVKGDFRLRYMVDTEEMTYHQGKGIFLLAYPEGEVQITEGSLRLRDYPAIWR